MRMHPHVHTHVLMFITRTQVRLGFSQDLPMSRFRPIPRFWHSTVMPALPITSPDDTGLLEAPDACNGGTEEREISRVKIRSRLNVNLDPRRWLLSRERGPVTVSVRMTNPRVYVNRRPCALSIPFASILLSCSVSFVRCSK